jgi:hypothetical protein
LSLTFDWRSAFWYLASRQLWKPAFIESAVAAEASIVSLVSGLVSWAFTRASFVASLAFVSFFNLRLEDFSEVPSSRASPASPDSAAFAASSYAF